MKLGIVGLPNVGKSSLFNAITQAGAESANYPFCTIEPNVGVVAVPDNRLEKLAKLYPSKRSIPTAIEFCDIAGLVKGASRGEGLGNQFLSHIREVDAIIHLVRCFENEDVVHVDGSIEPIRDIGIINLELILSDIELLQKSLERRERAAKADKDLMVEVHTIKKVLKTLEMGKAVKDLDLKKDEVKMLKSFGLLSLKPVIYVANISEEDLINDKAKPYLENIKEYASEKGAQLVAISAEIEEEISQLDDGEKKIFLKELGINKSGLDKLILASYELLNLISFFTVGPKEARAWTITKDTPAPKAAGKIHTDMERGFIRAEIISYNDLANSGSIAAVREKGLLRIEGKEYIMQDGDIALFRFNV